MQFNRKSNHGKKWREEELSKLFLEGVRGAIPGVDYHFLVFEKIIKKFFPQARTFLDLGCGNGVLGKFLLDILPTSIGVFADFSKPMLDAARKNIDDFKRASFVELDFGNSNWAKSFAVNSPFDIVVSGLAIHHQADIRKKAIYADIFELLNDGGLFLHLEHVAARSTKAQKVFDEIFLDKIFKLQELRGENLTREEAAQKYYYREDKHDNILTPVETQCDWLREIGFVDVDCFFKLFEIAIFGGCKRGGQK